MRVVLVISGKSLGGTKQAFLDHCQMLENMGFDVYPMIRRGSQLLPYCKHFKRVIQLRFYRSSFSFVRAHAVRVFRRQIQAIDPAIIITHKQIDLPTLKAACPGIPLVAIAHGFNARDFEHADCVLPVSEAVATYLRQRGMTAPMNVLPNAISVGERQAYRVPGECIRLGALAVFRRKKNLEMLLDACLELKRLGHSFRCSIAGSGHRRLHLKYLIWKKGLSGHVKLLSWVTDKESFLRSLDVYCVTSNTETFNISLLEAMIHSIPVVSTDCGGPSEIINSSAVGHLIPVGDVAALVAAIQAVIADTENTEKRTQAAYDRVKHTYDYSVIEPKLAVIIRQLVRRFFNLKVG